MCLIPDFTDPDKKMQITGARFFSTHDNESAFLKHNLFSRRLRRLPVSFEMTSFGDNTSQKQREDETEMDKGELKALR